MIKKIIDITFNDINFTIYHITSVVFLILFILIYVLIFSIETKFILNKNKYYVKTGEFTYTDSNGDDYNSADDSKLVINSVGKKRILLFSFIFAVSVSIIVHGISILLL